ncbi:MAG: hypothetical protein A3J93_02600 [Candidatus Magasanikbacteria bacterium RIFOXYC2_FULL_42_28]|uniref:Uncharacterized protein n=1 Tax=Candidatus Magasanikbacteria bacterium RIFOXYC2_FULL_42_28 TaxID=1798704 RepID=A0A1F6NW03_9BACT|nr:MAG: hypothetical protein A3J93_02600 [Candidatus Magasanikbacteria bacterium RIFOXYC2_FULL_42_28]
MDIQHNREVDFGHSSVSKDKKLPELDHQTREIVDTLSQHKADLLQLVHKYENEALAPDRPYEEGKSVDSEGRSQGFSYTVVNSKKFQIDFNGLGLYHGQSVEIEVAKDDTEESGTLEVKTTLIHEEQASAGTLLRAVNEILIEQGYRIVN